MSRPARVVSFGDRALLVETAGVAEAHALAAALRDDPVDAFEEVVVGFACVLVVLDPDPDVADLEVCRARLGAWAAGLGLVAARPGGTIHRLPVVFDGDDLDEAAGLVGLTRDTLVDLVVDAELEVAFVGFAPGFPYLTGLPEPVRSLPRRATPRPSVPAGSVAVAGGFASVYPRSTPGGWHLLGRTAVPLFDASNPPHGRVAPGDRVRFVVAGDDLPGLPEPTVRALLDTGDGPALDIVAPGLLSLVEDRGRRRVAALGVPAAGAADPEALTAVNLLLGNDPGAAAIECTATGPAVRMVGAGHVAVVGSVPGAVDVSVDGRPVADGTVVPVADGQVVAVGRVQVGLRAYLGVAGGIVVPRQLGSASSDVLTGLGPGALRAGDRLGRGPAGRPRGRLLPGPPRVGTLRVVPGPHAGDGPSGGPGDRTALDRLAAAVWRVDLHADRIGLRLVADDGTTLGGATVGSSVPMVTGAVQLPPDGRPIVLLPDHATVGGYPVVACVISADVAALGQLAPGDPVRFEVVDLPTARQALRRWRRGPAGRVGGWFPTATAT